MAAQFRVKFEQPPPGVPFKAWAEVIAHLNKQQTTDLSGVSEYLILVQGQLPNPDDRTLPILVTDQDGNLLYWAKYVAEGDACCNEGEICPLIFSEIGELKTLFRTETSMTNEKNEKKLFSCGWALADGTGAASAFPDLTGDAAHFSGAAPDWDKYTLVYTGTSS